MYVQRFLETEIMRYLKRREIIAVVGARQCGKTTLLRHIFSGLKNAVFLDFEDMETLGLFEHDVKAFSELYAKPYDYMFIDEFQYAKSGGKNLKYIFDNFDAKIFISGSSVSGLSIHSIRFLVGRIFVFELFPFSFEEYLNYKAPTLYRNVYVRRKKLSEQVIKKIAPYFGEFCVYGGYPRVILSENRDEKGIVLKNIYNTYFLKEIKEILNLPDDHKLSKLINALALQTGNIINYNELSEITGFRHKELLNYINVLEKTYICARSRPFHTNKRAEIVKAPKIFFFDNGFRNTVIKNFQPVKERQDRGALYENFAASEMAKKGVEIKYWRSKAKAEVDFIVEKKGAIMPVDIKSVLKTSKVSKSFHSFMEKYRPKKGLVFSESLFAEKGKVKFRPVFYLSREI